MLLVWTGWGILAPVLAIGVLVAVQSAVDGIFGSGYYTAHAVPKFIGLGLGALAIFLVGQWLESRPGRTLVDPATGQEVVTRRSDTFFYLPLKYWAVVVALIAAWLLSIDMRGGRPL